MTGINVTTRQNDRTNLYYIFTTSQIDWNKLHNKSNWLELILQQVKLTGINFTTSQIDWNKAYNKSNWME